MGRIAGDARYYEFRLCKVSEQGVYPTEYGFKMPSTTTHLKAVLGIPASAMAWTGFKLALAGIVEAVAKDPSRLSEALEDAALLQNYLKEQGISPNMSLEAAGARGTRAHDIAELMAQGKRLEALEAAALEAEDEGTSYGYAAISFWVNEVDPYVESGEILKVLYEVPVFSFKNWTCGTFDLALLWAEANVGDKVLPQGWEVIDYKTHKPASGFTLDGKGAGYDSDAAQTREYRSSLEEMAEIEQWLTPSYQEMELGPTIGQRTVVLRDSGKYLEDKREVPELFPVALRGLYDDRQAFEAGQG